VSPGSDLSKLILLCLETNNDFDCRCHNLVSILTVPTSLSVLFNDAVISFGYTAPVINECVCVAMVEWYRRKPTSQGGEKPLPFPLCPPQIPRIPSWDRTQVSAVTDWRLTAWIIARRDYAIQQTIPWRVVNVYPFLKNKLSHWTGL
jgi:hypothetical protein